MHNIELTERIKNIHSGDLRGWIKKQMAELALDFGQTVAPDEATHLVNRITDEVSKKRDWTLGEVVAAIDSGKKGVFGKQYSKVTVIRVLDWLNEQTRIREKKYIVRQMNTQQDEKKPQASPISEVGRMFFEAQRLSKKYMVSISAFPSLKDMVSYKRQHGQDGLEMYVKELRKIPQNEKPQNALV